MMVQNSTLAPSGHGAHVGDETNIGPAVFALAVIEATVALASVLLRICVRAMIIQRLSWDDHYIVVSAVRKARSVRINA